MSIYLLCAQTKQVEQLIESAIFATNFKALRNKSSVIDVKRSAPFIFVCADVKRPPKAITLIQLKVALDGGECWLRSL